MENYSRKQPVVYHCQKQSIWRNDSRIFSGEMLIAELQYNNNLKTQAKLTTDSDSWTLEKASLFSSEFSVFSDKTQEEVAYLENVNGFSHRLRLRYQPEVKIRLGRKLNLWNYVFQWEDENNRPMMIFTHNLGWGGYQTTITIYPEDCVGLDVPFLCGLGVYISTIMRMYASAAT